MGRGKFKLIETLFYPNLFVAFLWTIEFYETYSGVRFTYLGILPRHLSGIPGIITAPLIHGDMFHLFSNTIPLVLLGMTVFYFYRTIAFPVFFVVYLLSNLIVWIVASENGYHVGASGLVYGFVSFLFFSGIFRKDKRSMILSILVVIVYGGLIWGMLPVYEGVSWESHFFGSVSGAISAYVFRKADKVIELSSEKNISDENNLDER